MPKNNVNDPITDQEVAFARLILSGTMNDRHAAEAVGLHPESAAYTKSKPRVRAYMFEHRAAVQQQLVEQDAQELRRFSLGRDQILARLWEIANLDPETTRGSASAQVKALSMIVAMEGLIPDRRVVSAQNKSAPSPINSDAAGWRTSQHTQNVDPEPPSPSLHDEALALESATVLDHGQSTSPGPLNPSPTISSPPPPVFPTVPDTRVPFSINKNPFARRH